MEQQLKDNYPGPGQYEAASVERNKQTGLSSHFAKAVGRDFANVQKLKMIIEKNTLNSSSSAIPIPIKNTSKELGQLTRQKKSQFIRIAQPKSYSRTNLEEMQKLQQQEL